MPFCLACICLCLTFSCAFCHVFEVCVFFCVVSCFRCFFSLRFFGTDEVLFWTGNRIIRKKEDGKTNILEKLKSEFGYPHSRFETHLDDCMKTKSHRGSGAVCCLLARRLVAARWYTWALVLTSSVIVDARCLPTYLETG